jgi:hypothetical protein
MMDSTDSQNNKPKFCINCGTAYVPGQKFCGVCGKTLDLKSIESPSTSPEMTLRSKSGRRWLGCGIILIIISLFSYGVTSSSAVPYMTNCSLKHWNDLETYAIANCLFPHPIFWWLWQLIYLVPGVLFLYRGIKVNRNTKRVEESK